MAVGRAGKRLFVELDSGDRLVIEPRMTGRVLLAGQGTVPDRPSVGARLRENWDSPLEVDRPPAIGDRAIGRPGDATCVFGFPRPGRRAAAFGRGVRPETRAGRLGPDALEVSAEELRERLKRAARAIKVALLDQRAVAGVGNLYASEILHRADPTRRLRATACAATG